MSTTIEHEPTDDGTVTPLRSSQSSRNPLATLTAAAIRLTQKIADRVAGRSIGKKNSAGWEEDAWDMYDLVGEQRFLAGAIAGRMAQARLYVGKVSDDPTQPPTPLPVALKPGEDPPEDYVAPTETDLKAAAALDAFGDTAQGRAQLIERMGVNLFMVGKGWYAGIPKTLLEAALNGQSATTPTVVRNSDDIIPIPDASTVEVDDLVWKMFSISEVNVDGNTAQIRFQDSGDPVSFNLDTILLIKIWRSHPRRAWEADSPVRSSLPVLRELVGLTMHISAQIDSRLAGAGLFLIPQGARDAMKRNIQGNQNTGDESDPFADSVMEAGITAIQDRASAAALMPIMLTVPDDSIEKFKHISFATPLDAEARPLREESIRRVALGEDAPPELLLGTGAMNHWGAWLGQEDTVKNHVVPPLSLICDGVTTEYLWEVLVQQGVPETEAQQYVIWHETDHLIVRPNKSADAKIAHDAGAINDEALRDALGFDDQDAPTGASADPAVLMVIDMLKQAPSLGQTPGIPALVAQVRAMMEGKPVPDSPTPQTPPSGTEGEPAPDGGSIPAESDGEPAPMAASGNLPALRSARNGAPNVYVQMPEQAPPQFSVHMPEGMVTLNVEPTPVNVNNRIDVEPTPINVQPASGPPIIVEPSTVQVVNEVNPTPVTVESPTVNVEAPTVNVEAAPAPDVTVNVPESQVTVNIPEGPAPTVEVNVPAPEVTVNVEAPETPEPKRAKIQRGEDGLITGVEYED